MKCKSAMFVFFDVAGCEGDVRVAFYHDRKTGKPTEVHVHTPCTGKEHEGSGNVLKVANASGRYKPCKTHCLDLIRQALGKPPADNFAARRVEEQRRQKPALKVHKWGHGN